MAAKAAPKPTLRAVLVAVFALLAFGITALFTWLIIEERSMHVKQRVSDDLEELAFQVAQDLDRSLFERYREIAFLAQAEIIRMAAGEPRRLETIFDDLQQSYPFYSRIGFATADGTLLAGNGGLPRGGDVSDKAWFRRGRQGLYFGDLHADLPPPEPGGADGDGPPLLIDMAMPVHDRAGTLLGVLGVHLDWRWAETITTQVLRPQEQRLDTQVIIADRNGLVIFGPSTRERQHRVPVRAGAMMGVGNAIPAAPWPDGEVYTVGLRRTSGYEAFPGFGWTVLVRQPTRIIDRELDAVARHALGIGLLAALAFAAIGGYLAAQITRPLRAIADATGRIREEGLRAPVPVTGAYREAHQLGGAINELLAHLAEHEEQLYHAETRDPVTALVNDTEFRTRLARHIHRSQQTGFKPYLLLVKIDGAAELDSAYGHAFRDQAMRSLAERLTTAARFADTVARYSANQFAVIALYQGEVELLASSAASIVAGSIGTPLTVEGIDLSLTATVGISVYPTDGADADTLLKSASAAVLRGERLGGNRILHHDSAFAANVTRRVDLLSDLRNALDRGELQLAYQPQIDGRRNRVIGAEALLRWRRPDGEPVSPAEFIPLAEESGLIVPIGHFVLEAACRQAAAWRRSLLHDMTIAVNLSERQLTADFPDKVAQVLADCDLPAAALELEITEGTLFSDLSEARGLIARLRDLGVQIAIDDFGTGYSSIAYLKHIQADRLKIDQLFVRNLRAGGEDHVIVKAICDMAANLNLEIIAEGVEQPEQLAILRALGCHAYQGYHFSRPLEAESFTAFVQTWRHDSPAIPMPRRRSV